MASTSKASHSGCQGGGEDSPLQATKPDLPQSLQGCALAHLEDCLPRQAAAVSPSRWTEGRPSLCGRQASFLLKPPLLECHELWGLSQPGKTFDMIENVSKVITICLCSQSSGAAAFSSTADIAAGLAAFVAQAKYDSIVLELITLSSAVVLIVRVVLGYKRMYDRYSTHQTHCLQSCNPLSPIDSISCLEFLPSELHSKLKQLICKAVFPRCYPEIYKKDCTLPCLEVIEFSSTTGLSRWPMKCWQTPQ